MRDLIEVGGAIAAAVIAAYLALQKYLVLRSKDTTIKTSESAITEQFKVLQEALEANRKEAAEARKETAELRLEFSRMDRTIHGQQRTITRMEVLLRQFAGLVQDSGIIVPKYMQDELQVLIVPSGEILAERRAKR
tara:strand:- start:4658 stop:5065 length:408 start_codon:yes stop_codon:yes gene_type:complete